ncbi:unnamed protein product [Microthlaspi erraticum]|uniref:Uncharacterized protein n=1 Tax=Microthlaspi erraticum TaxID=1685480 RepID=A0A6D2L943_9BRAS|nr:unnamed protein product [Microthlaspi erraticum]
MSRGQAVQAFATISRARPHRANREASPRGRAAQLTSYSQKSGDCPDGSIERAAPKPRSPAGRGTHVPRSAKAASVRLKSRPSPKPLGRSSITTRETYARGRPRHNWPRHNRARPKRASREVTPRGRATHLTCMTRRSNKDNLVEHPEIDKLEKQLRKQKPKRWPTKQLALTPLKWRALKKKEEIHLLLLLIHKTLLEM